MTCPMTLTPTSEDVDTDDARAAGDLFERVGGSWFIALFATALFDQAMLPAVSAALEDTGRIRNDPWWRGLRSAASDQIVFHGLADDRRAETERLVSLHREVKGVSPDGVRYSALNPESWNWILISTFMMYRSAVAVITGTEFTPAGNQGTWDRFLSMTAGLQLSGRSALPCDYHVVSAYYDRVAAEKLEFTATLDCAVAAVLRAPRPDFVPTVLAPLWNVTSPVAGHIVSVLGFGVMRPQVRNQIPMSWGRRHDIEFAVLARTIQLAYRWLPARMTDTPLARNRREYARLVAKYRGVGLTSFAPGSA